MHRPILRRGTIHALIDQRTANESFYKSVSIARIVKDVPQEEYAMKRIVMTLVAVCALMAVGTQAKAQGYGGYGGGGYGGGGYGGGGYGGGGYGNGGYGGGGYGNGGYGSYFGNGGHDFQPHGHVTQSQYGQSSWYGNGPHDFVPHQNSKTPWSYQGYSNTGSGPTTSFYNQQPNYSAPW
jgi:hypothetical protein